MMPTSCLGLLITGTVIPLACCATAGPRSVTPPSEIWLKSGDLDDLRDAPAGHPIMDWRLRACPGFPSGHVPSGFLAQLLLDSAAPMQQYFATGVRAERDQVVWWQYSPPR